MSTLAAEPTQLEQLLTHLERRVGSAMLTIQRPRPGDWQAVVFRDHERVSDVVYVSGHGDTLADAIHDLLADPMATA